MPFLLLFIQSVPELTDVPSIASLFGHDFPRDIPDISHVSLRASFTFRSGSASNDTGERHRYRFNHNLRYTVLIANHGFSHRPYDFEKLHGFPGLSRYADRKPVADLRHGLRLSRWISRDKDARAELGKKNPGAD